LDVVFCCTLALFLRELVVPSGAILCGRLVLLVHAFTAERFVARRVADGFLPAAEEFVEQ
jgi:hypothetical protein